MLAVGGKVMRLEGKTVIITGASAGMGQAMTELFVHEGANVVAVARRKERLDALAESLKDGPGKVAVFAGDIGKKEDNEAMIDCAVETFGKLDVLINNAGIMDDNTAIGDMSDEMLDRLMKVDAYGPMYAMRKAVQVFLKQGEGGNNGIAPGGVITDIPLVMPAADEFGFSRTSTLLTHSPELGMPEDIANAALFLASDESKFVNGVILTCDGGWTNL